MAGGFAISIDAEGKRYNGKMTWFVAVSCMVAAMGGVLYGYDIGVSGGVTSMEPFLKKFFPEIYRRMKEDTHISNYCVFDSQILTSFTSSLYLAGLVGTFFSSYITRAYGRKPSILIGGAAFLAGGALGGAAFNIYMLILGRVMLGIGVSFTNQAIPIYLSEMAPAKYRGAINSIFQVCLCFGVLSANLINYGTERIRSSTGWRISLSAASIPALILTLGAFLLPETPNSLIQRFENDHKRAKTMLQRIRGTDDVEAEFQDLVRSNEVSKTMKHPWRNILQRKYRPQFVIAICFPIFQQATGINVIGFYAPQLFRTIGLGERASLLSAVMTGVVGTCCTMMSMLVVDRFGRRALFLVGGAQMLVCQIATGAIMATKVGDHGGLSKGYGYLVLALICVYVAGFSWSWGPLPWLVPSEIFPLEIRSIGQGTTVAVVFVFTFIFAQTFLAMLCHFKAGIFFFFGGWVVLMSLFVLLLLPETKNVPIELMDSVWREHWFWKRFVVDETQATKI